MTYKGLIDAKEVTVTFDIHEGELGACQFCKEKPGHTIEVEILKVMLGPISKAKGSILWERAEDIFSSLFLNGKVKCDDQNCAAISSKECIERVRVSGFVKVDS